MINGSLASLVAVCASVDAIEFYNALVLGIVAGVVYELFSVGLLKLHIDDPIGMYLSVQGCCNLSS